MSHELTVEKTGAIVSAIQQQGVGELLQPLIREIHLFDTFVAGTTQLPDSSVLERLHVEDKLQLVREHSKFDRDAVKLLTEGGEKIGYVPEKDNTIFARLMDAGKLLSAKITQIQREGSFHKIRIGIYLVDF